MHRSGLQLVRTAAEVEKGAAVASHDPRTAQASGRPVATGDSGKDAAMTADSPVAPAMLPEPDDVAARPGVCPTEETVAVE